MSTIEKVEVEIDRVITYLSCGCVKKSDIFINPQAAARAKRENVKSEFCPRHDWAQSIQIYFCENCRTVNYIHLDMEDVTIDTLIEKMREQHDHNSPRCFNMSGYMVPSTYTEEQVRRKAPDWAVEAILIFLGEEQLHVSTH